MGTQAHLVASSLKGVNGGWHPERDGSSLARGALPPRRESEVWHRIYGFVPAFPSGGHNNKKVCAWRPLRRAALFFLLPFAH